MGSDVQPGTEMEIIVEETVSARDVSNVTILGVGEGLWAFGLGSCGNPCLGFEVLRLGFT